MCVHVVTCAFRLVKRLSDVRCPLANGVFLYGEASTDVLMVWGKMLSRRT